MAPCMKRDQIAGGAVAPTAHEEAARELRGVVAAAEIGAVASGAVGLIGGAAGIGLRRRCRACAVRLLAGEHSTRRTRQSTVSATTNISSAEHESQSPISKASPTGRRPGPSRCESGRTARRCAGSSICWGVRSTDPVMVPLVGLGDREVGNGGPSHTGGDGAVQVGRRRRREQPFERSGDRELAAGEHRGHRA